jgi:hypothetical protein
MSVDLKIGSYFKKYVSSMVKSSNRMQGINTFRNLVKTAGLTLWDHKRNEEILKKCEGRTNF